MMAEPSGGLSPVHIGEVDDPTSFWITPVRKFSDPKVKSVMEMEQDLSQFCERNPSDNQGVRAGSLVAVRKGPGVWLRGRVEHLVTSLRGLSASVFLVDWGERLHNVRVAHDVTRLPMQISQDLEQLAHKLVLRDVVGPWGEDVLDAVRTLVKGSESAFVGELLSGGGVLRGGLYLDLPFDGDCQWRRSVPPILLQLLDGYNTDRIYLNGMLKDLVKQISTSQNMPRNKPSPGITHNFVQDKEMSGNVNIVNGRSLEGNDNFKYDRGRQRNDAGKVPPENINTKRNHFEDTKAQGNSESSLKTDGTRDLRNVKPDTSTPLNSSIDRETTKPKPAMGRATRLKERIKDRKVGLPTRGEENISDISAADLSGIYGFQEGSSSFNSSGKGEQTSRFGIMSGGVKIIPGGGDSSSVSSASDSVNSSSKKSSIINSRRGISREDITKGERTSRLGIGSGGGDKRNYQKDTSVENMLDIGRESGRGVLDDGVYRSSNRSRRNMANSNVPLTGPKERLHKQFKLPERMFGRGRTLAQSDEQPLKGSVNNHQPYEGRDQFGPQSSREQGPPAGRDQLNVQLQKWRVLNNQPPKRTDMSNNQSPQTDVQVENKLPKKPLNTHPYIDGDESDHRALGFKGQFDHQYPRGRGHLHNQHTRGREECDNQHLQGKDQSDNQYTLGRGQIDNQFPRERDQIGNQNTRGRGQLNGGRFVNPPPSGTDQMGLHSHGGRNQFDNQSLQMFGRGRVLDNQVSQRMFGRGRGPQSYPEPIRHQETSKTCEDIYDREVGKGKGIPRDHSESQGVGRGRGRGRGSEMTSSAPFQFDFTGDSIKLDPSKTNKKPPSFSQSQELSPQDGLQTSAVPDQFGSTRPDSQNSERPKLLKPFDRNGSAAASNSRVERKAASNFKSETHSKSQHGPELNKNEDGTNDVDDPTVSSDNITDSAVILAASSEDVDDDKKITSRESSLSESESNEKPKLLKLGAKSKEVALPNTGLKENSKLKPLNNDMKDKLKKKISKLKENEEVLSQSKDASEIDDPNKVISEATLPSNTENESPESDESASELIDEDEDPLETLIRNLNKTSNNESYKEESKKVTLTMSGTKFYERFNSREAWTRLLMHRPSKSLGGRPCKLADHTNQLSWHGDLLRYLREAEVTYSTIIQSALWPAVTRLMSVVGIAGKGQGKTNGWTLPLLSNLSDHDHYRALPLGKGPTAVVLAAGWKTVRDIAELLEDTSKRARLEVTVAAAYSGREKDLMPALINGVDVLVATPCCILRLINTYKFTDLERCCHFVIEEADRLLEWFPQEVELLVGLWKKVGLKFKGLPDQTIVVAERWSEAVKQFVAKHKEDFGLIVLGSFLEGVVYGHLSIIPHFFKYGHQKWEKLLEIVQDRGENRLCICCRDAKVGSELVNRLREVGIESLFIDETDDPGDRGDKLDIWRENHNLPLVLTDLALMFVIDPIPTDVLVHWDLPRDSKKEFGIRFVMLKPAMKSFYGEANPMPGEFRYEENNMDPGNACVHLMLGRENSPMLRTIMHLLKRTGTVIPQELNGFYFGLKTNQAKEAVLSGQPLCSQLASRGVCRDRKLERCNQRHFLHNEMDQPTTYASGILEFLILHVETPVRYWVRIKDPVLDRKYQSLMMRLGRFYTKEKNVKVLTEEEIAIGRVVVVRSGEGGFLNFRRARILNKLYHDTRYKKLILREIEVFMLDEGTKEFVKPGDVLQLLPDLGLEPFPPSAAAVVVAGLLPQDRDSDWSVSAGMFVNNKLNLHSDDHELVCRGRVLLAIGNTYWVNKCQLMVKQDNIGKFICAFETRESLKAHSDAVDNPGHMEPLYQLAARAGIARPEVDPEVESVAASSILAPVEQARVAFLPRDAAGCKVFMSECYSPSLFYVHKVEHSSRLTELERDMEIWAEDQGLPAADWRPRVGEYVMARRPQEDAWLRGRVQEKLYEDKDGDYGVFFVDIGDTCGINLSNLIPIHEKFVKRLPFQAVKCSLAYIKPILSTAQPRRVGQENCEADNEALCAATEIYTNIVDTAVKRSDLVQDDNYKKSGSNKTNQNETDNSVNDIDLDDEDNIEWCTEAGNVVWDSSRGVNDQPVQLWCKVEAVKGEEHAKLYEVRLVVSSTDVEVGVQLVDDGLAEDKLGQLRTPFFQPEEGLEQGYEDDSNIEEDWDNSNNDEEISFEENWENPVQVDGETGTCPDAAESTPKFSLNPEDYDFSLGGEIINELSNLGPRQKALNQKACLEYMSGKQNPNDDQFSSQYHSEESLNNEKVKIFSQTKKNLSPDRTAVTPFVPPVPLQMRVRPSDLPAPCPAVNLCEVEMRKPAVLWSQDHSTLRITVAVNSVADIKPEQVYLRVDSQGINIQVLEIVENEEFIMHTTEFLKLYSKVCTHGTTLKVLGRSLVITLVKRTTCHWRQLTKFKLGWIKVDHDKQLSSDSEDDRPVERPAVGFMSEYVTPVDTGRVHEPRYNTHTGEQVMPEYMFTSSDEAGSEDQDLDFIHDGAVDYEREEFVAS